MSLIPLLSDHLDLYRPSRLLDQHFGLGLDEEDILSAFMPRRLRRSLSSPYSRPWQTHRKDVGSIISRNKDNFQVNLDVQQFAPEEITVKATGENTITVEGKHEEKEDEHGYISRHFLRRYSLPKGHDLSKCVSKLSTDGVLTITAPKVDTGDSKGIEIPITLTNQPSRIESRKGESLSIGNGSGEDEDVTVKAGGKTKSKKKN